MAEIVPTWQDSPSTTTPIDAANLNEHSTAIRHLDTRVTNLGIDVKTDYGATGDGSTDDTTAIQNALNAAAGTATTTAYTVFMPPGVYVLQPCTIPHGVTVRGAGLRSTTIIAKSGLVTGSYLLSQATNARMMTVRDLRMQGNTANQGTAVINGLKFDGGTGTGATEYTDMRCQTHNVHIEDFSGDAFTFIGRGVCQISDCVAWSNKGNGFYIDIDSELTNCDAGGCKNGFRITGNSLLSNCKAWFSGYYNGSVPAGVVSGGDGHGFKFDSASSGNAAIGLNAQDNAACGIKLLNSSRIAIAGYVVDSNNNFTGGTVNNIELNNSYNCTLVSGHNLDRQPGNAARPASGLQILSGASNNYVQFTTAGLQSKMNTTGLAYQNIIDIDQSGGGSVSGAFATSFTPDNTSGAIIDIGALTANMTVNAPSLNITSSKNLTLMFTQDATGGRTLTFNSVYITGGWQPTSTAGALSNITFAFNGNTGKWHKISSTP